MVRGVILTVQARNTVEIITVPADGDALEIDLDGNADTAEITIDAGTTYRVESGGFKPTGSDTNENEFTFYYAVGGDSDGEFLGGKDTFDFGAQVNIFDSEWNVTTSVDETALLAKLDLAAADTTGIPQGFLDAILGDNDVADLQASTEAFEWGGGSETTYVLGGAVLGYAETHTYDDGAGGTGSNTSYYDSNHNHVGHSYTDSYGGSGSNFRITLEVADIPTDDDGPIVDAGGASHVIVESGSNTWPGMDGGSEESSEYTHYYVAEMAGDPAAPTGEIDWNATPSHLGGSDIYNGVITNWGPDWTNEGSKVDADAMAASDDYTAVESTDGLPSSFSTAAYSSSETYDWGGSEVTYYADDGSVLGYANVSTWDDGMGGTGTNTGYSDSDYNYLGGSWSDSYGSGSNTVEIITVPADGDAVEIDLDGNADTAEITIDAGTTYRVESGGFKPAGSDTNENEYIFYYGSVSSSDGEEGEEAEAEAEAVADPAFIEQAIQEIQEQIEETESDISYAQGQIDTMQADISGLDPVADADGIAAIEQGIADYEADISGYEEDLASLEEDLASAQADLATAQNAAVGADQASSGQEMFTFLGGKDTFDFGAQVNIYDSEWNVTTSVDESALLAKLDLAAADTTGILGFLDAILGDNDVADLQAATEAFEWGGGSETTYVLGGAVLGYAETHTYDDGAGGTSSNTSYYDSNHNHVGHSYEDSYGSGSNFRITLEVADIPTDDDGPIVDAGGASHVIVESGSSTWQGMDAGSEESSEYTHYYVAEMAGDPAAPTGEIDFNATPSHLGGSDIYNGVVTNWGPGWENLGQSLGDFSFEDAIADPDSGYSAVESTDGLPPAFSTAAYMYEDSHGS